MNKKELIDKLSEKTNYNKTVCLKVFNETINLIKESFYFGASIRIKDFGKFGHKEIKARKRYVPSLKSVRYEKPKIVPKFTPSKNFYGKML